MSFDGVRCTDCNAIDADEYLDGTARCANCGMPLIPDTAAPKGEGQVIFPLLVWSWSPCQTCGSTDGEHGNAEDDVCRECGTTLAPIKRRAVAEGFPVRASPGSASPEDARLPLEVGDRGVCVGGNVQLIGAGPFTLLQVTAVRVGGDVDVAAVHDGTQWAAVPQDALLQLR